MNALYFHLWEFYSKFLNADDPYGQAKGVIGILLGSNVYYIVDIIFNLLGYNIIPDISFLFFIALFIGLSYIYFGPKVNCKKIINQKPRFTKNLLRSRIIAAFIFFTFFSNWFWAPLYIRELQKEKALYLPTGWKSK